MSPPILRRSDVAADIRIFKNIAGGRKPKHERLSREGGAVSPFFDNGCLAVCLTSQISHPVSEDRRQRTGQRGICASLPNTICPEEAAPPLDVLAAEASFRSAFIARRRIRGSGGSAPGALGASRTQSARPEEIFLCAVMLDAPARSEIANKSG